MFKVKVKETLPAQSLEVTVMSILVGFLPAYMCVCVYIFYGLKNSLNIQTNPFIALLCHLTMYHRYELFPA